MGENTSIAVVTEVLRGQLTEQSFEALAAARTVTHALLGGEVVAVLCGTGNAGLLSQLGAADRVLHLADPALDQYSPEAYEAALRAALGERAPRLIIVPNTTVGMDLAAGLAGLLELPLAAYCIALAADGAAVVATSQIYGGKLLAEVALAGPAVVSIVPGSFPAADGRKDGAPPVEEVAGTAPARVRLVEYTVAESGDVDITKQAVLVSVGRGLGGPENLEVAEALATALGGVVSGSRPVTDSGWLPKSRQVGKSGVTVTPKLYLALGISGAPEHLQGMKGSELIVAINSDATAPIFNVAHYGIVGDLLEVVPALTEKLAG